MATYNGERYVEEQIASILHQIGPNDEIIVVDDASTDATVSLLRGVGDFRIRVISSATNTGHVAAFERALGLARGSIILLSDQDDVWLPGRVGLMRQALVERAYVASNWRVLGGGLPASEIPTLRAHDSRSPLWNIIRIYLGTMPYFGCAMGFRREALAKILPFPRATDAHDHWIAMLGNVDGGICHLDEYTVARRLHDKNLTFGRRSIGLVVVSRVKMTMLTAAALARRDWFGRPYFAVDADVEQR
ncbi:MAG: glycosyltransferase [Kineosporiaceae bacterium]|nr:glycosyltransferase [Aeromicrobium sp.]